MDGVYSAWRRKVDQWGKKSVITHNKHGIVSRTDIYTSQTDCCPGVSATHITTIRKIIYFIMLLNVSVATKDHMAQSETEYKVSDEMVRIVKEAVMACLNAKVSH